MPELIQSKTNPRIQHIVKLQGSSRLRREEGLFVIEGLREIARAAASGFEISDMFVCPDIDDNSLDEFKTGQIQAKRTFQVTKNVFERLAYRESTGGVIAIAKQRSLTLDDLSLKANPLLLVLESVEKPGNLGAVLRTADGAGIDAVIICDPLTDIFNPNVIRSSVGCVFSEQIVACTSPEAIKWLKSKGIHTYAAALTADAKPYYAVDYTDATAIVMGTEATGLSALWLEKSDMQIIVPMNGIADSLNVSTAAAILAYEALRQRLLK